MVLCGFEEGWVNQHGNAWGEGIEIKGTPRFALGDSVQIVDLMGSGTPGILWSFERTGTQTRMYYLDLCRGVKPYVLNEMNNNMGAITRVEYTSSIRHYLRDLYGTSVTEDPQTNLPDTLDMFIGSAGKWKTTLPFPTQVVNRVEVIDEISEGKLTTHYFYHHGYWDGGEREFRGFGRVDQFDSEDFNHFNDTSLHLDANFEGVSQLHYSPPMLVKNWFHLGPVGAATGDWDQLFFENEYHQSDPQVLPPSPETLQLLANLPRRARRDALRTLRGTALRTESYAVDGSNRQFKPYTVSETRAGLKLEDHPGNNPTIKMLATQRHSNHIFFSFTDGSRTTQWERGNDPMVQFSFSGDFDDYGQPRRALSAALPRGIMSPYTDATTEVSEEDGGGSILATLSLTDYADGDYEPKYMVDRVCRSLSYEVLTALNVFDLREALFDPELEVDITDTDEQTINNDLSLKVIGCQLNYYDGNAFTGLGYGELGEHGAVVQSETLVLTDTIISAVYSETPEFFKETPDLSGYPQGFQDNLQNDDNHLGYLKYELPQLPELGHAPAGWYAPGAKTKYDFQDGGNTDPRGLVEETRDAFDNRSTIAYDSYKMLPVSSQQYLNATDYLETTAQYDYRLLQAQMVTDPNGNRSVFGFSPLGLLMKSGVIGKDGESEGDIITETPFDWKPSVQMEYDFLAWYEEQKPVWVKTIQNEQHYQDDEDSPTIAKVEFSDGFGRLLQTRAQAEDVIFGATEADRIFGDSGLPADQQATNANAEGTERESTDPLNVVVSGWQVYDNKGRVVEQYEPFFSQGLDDYAPVEESQKGQKLTMFYDPAGRVVRTVNPDGSEQRLVVGIPPNINNPDSFAPSPWHHYAYDANDLADITDLENDNVAESHKFTPKSEIVDALGRTIKTTEHKAASDNGDPATYVDVVMKYEYDIRGNLLAVTDALDRPAFAYTYDLANQPLKTTHIDSGVSTAVIDAAGKPVEGSDAKEAEVLNAYDTLSRPQLLWAKDHGTDSFSLRQITIYGDGPFADLSQQQAADKNLLGQAYKTYDESGLIVADEFDFNGNLLKKSQKVLKDSLLQSTSAYTVDWPMPDDSNFDTLSSDLLEHKAHENDTTTDGYITENIFDALNRVVKITLPKDVDDNRKEIEPHYNRAGALEKVTFDQTTYVNHIAYNAKGQRILLALGNGVMTRYAYDDLTFRFVRQRTETYNQTDWEFSPDGSVKQDTAYSYDLAGNILGTTENRSNAGFGTTLAGGQGPTPDKLIREFDYDPLYRLILATGREDTSHSHNLIWQDTTPVAPTPTNSREYRRTYQYDKMGNILKLAHNAHQASFTRNFGYHSSMQHNKLEEVLDNSQNTLTDFQYDPAGNTVQNNSERFYVWDAANQLKQFKIDDGQTVSVYGQYIYSGGQRVKKLVKDQQGNYTITVYIDGVFEYQKLVKSANTFERNYTHIMDDRSRIATVRAGSDEDDITEDAFYIVEDHLNSSTARLKATDGSVIDRDEFYPFGETSLHSFSKKRYRYTGKEKDSESGLYYYGARYYSGWCCRFTSLDPLSNKYPEHSPFVYGHNSPLVMNDPTGMEAERGGGNGGGHQASKDQIKQSHQPTENVTINNVHAGNANAALDVIESKKSDLSELKESRKTMDKKSDEAKNLSGEIKELKKSIRKDKRGYRQEKRLALQTEKFVDQFLENSDNLTHSNKSSRGFLGRGLEKVASDFGYEAGQQFSISNEIEKGINENPEVNKVVVQIGIGDTGNVGEKSVAGKSSFETTGDDGVLTVQVVINPEMVAKDSVLANEMGDILFKVGFPEKAKDEFDKIQKMAKEEGITNQEAHDLLYLKGELLSRHFSDYISQQYKNARK